jgi:nucleoside-diphosphate-sugar epimerase
MRVVVTGAAGFIGSHLCDRLLAAGHDVTAIDCFSDFYPRALKEANLADAREHPNFRLHHLDLADDDLRDAMDGAEVVFHLASRSGLDGRRPGEFNRLVRDNVLGTQRLLEAIVDTGIVRLVHASSSSVYGEAERVPTREKSVPRPLSSYGVTKLAAEGLVHQYTARYELPATILRLFTVYGPRQRPDMAVGRFMAALARGDEIEVYGDGEQTRDFTFVRDVIDALIRSADPRADVVGRVINVGGGTRATVNEVLRAIENVAGRTARRRHLPAAPGDQRHCAASINLARRHLAWEPRVGLSAGLAEQWASHAAESRPRGLISA